MYKFPKNLNLVLLVLMIYFIMVNHVNAIIMIIMVQTICGENFIHSSKMSYLGLKKIYELI